MLGEHIMIDGLSDAASANHLCNTNYHARSIYLPISSRYMFMQVIFRRHWTITQNLIIVLSCQREADQQIRSWNWRHKKTKIIRWNSRQSWSFTWIGKWLRKLTKRIGNIGMILSQKQMKTEIKNCILLDNQLTIHYFCNHEILTNICKSPTTMTINTNAGYASTNLQATLPGLGVPVHPKNEYY